MAVENIVTTILIYCNIVSFLVCAHCSHYQSTESTTYSYRFSYVSYIYDLDLIPLLHGLLFDSLAGAVLYTHAYMY